MPDLYVTAAHPNPRGKDKPSRSAPTDDQLNEEWVEFSNPTDKTWDIAGISLWHTTFDQDCNSTSEHELISFTSGELLPDQSIRIHTGRGPTRTVAGRHHVFLGRGHYVWNNLCGDRAIIRANDAGIIDWAEYEPAPRDGQTLYRVRGTNQLR